MILFLKLAESDPGNYLQYHPIQRSHRLPSPLDSPLYTRKSTLKIIIYPITTPHHQTTQTSDGPTYKTTTCGLFLNTPESLYMQAALTTHPASLFSPPQTLAQTTPKTPYITTLAESTKPERSNRSRRNPNRELNLDRRARDFLDAQSRSHARWASS